MPMTEKKLVSAFEACSKILRREGVTVAERDGDASPDSVRGRKHLLWLAENGPGLVKEARREKACRWLGFLQGSLWALEFATIDDLKDMNRPDNVKFDSERV